MQSVIIKMRKKKKNVNFVKLFLLFLFLIFSLSSVFSHGEIDDGHGEDASYDSYSSFERMLPFIYFANGNIYAGIFIIVFWVLILRGLYVLAMFVIFSGISKK